MSWLGSALIKNRNETDRQTDRQSIVEFFKLSNLLFNLLFPFLSTSVYMLVFLHLFHSLPLSLPLCVCSILYLALFLPFSLSLSLPVSRQLCASSYFSFPSSFSPIDYIQSMNVLQSQSYLGSIKLRPIFGKSTHFSKMEKQFPASTIIQNKK